MPCRVPCRAGTGLLGEYCSMFFNTDQRFVLGRLETENETTLDSGHWLLWSQQWIITRGDFRLWNRNFLITSRMDFMFFPSQKLKSSTQRRRPPNYEAGKTGSVFVLPIWDQSTISQAMEKYCHDSPTFYTVSTFHFRRLLHSVPRQTVTQLLNLPNLQSKPLIPL